MLVNAGSLIGTTAVTSILGFVYWWVAARRFPPEAIGIASASVSAMMLLGGFCVLGLGTLLITELPRQPEKEGELISTALITVGGVGGCIGLIFALAAPYAAAGFAPLKASIANSILFAVGVSLTAVTLVLDQALIGLLRGELQFWRNTLFAAVKLVALFFVGLSGMLGMAIYATWVVANLFSLTVLFLHVVAKKKRASQGHPQGECPSHTHRRTFVYGRDIPLAGALRTYLPQWGLLRKLGFAALQHHLLNLTLQFPTLALPVLVTVVLSAKMNAWFYVSWMIVSFVFIVPGALTTVLHAMNSAQPSTLARKARVTIGLAVVTGLLANLVLQSATKQVLGLFGSAYADQAAWCLRILVLAAFPLIIKNHYISICRIQDRIPAAMLSMLPGGVLELVSAGLGAHYSGLSGLSIGWVLAICVESLFMARTVYRAVWSVEGSPVLAAENSILQEEASWSITTTPMPVIGQSYIGAESIWLTETTSTPALGDEATIQRGQQDSTNRNHKNGQYQLKPPQLRRYKIEHIPKSFF